jgi:hypothetical protein
MDEVSDVVKQQMIALGVCAEESGCDQAASTEDCVRDACSDELAECGL